MTDTTTIAPDAPAPSPIPAPAPGQPTEQITGATEPAHDDEGLDLLAVDGDDDAGAEVETSDAPEASVKPLGPAEDASEEQVAEWRAEHGVPDDPADYTAPNVEGIEWNKEALGPILETIHSHNIPQAAVADALTKYAEHVQAQHAAIKQRDAEAAKAVRSELTEAEIASVKSAAKAMPADLRSLLNQARGPDGARIINNPEVLRMITATYGARPGARTMHADVTDTRAGLQKELAEIDTAMYRDAAELRRPWKATGVSAAERKQQILDEVGNRLPAAKHRAEEAALLELHQRDPSVFEYSRWRGTEKTGAQRLLEIRSGRG